MTTPQALLLRQYLTFCESPLRGPESIEVEFQRLLQNPEVTHVAFHKPHILMVGTTPIVIRDEQVDIEIGEFIFFLIRKREEKIWETGFRFSNTTSPICTWNHESTLSTMIMHPHIMAHEYEDIALPTGELCIAHGQLEIYQALRKGHMDRVVALLLVVLKTYGTGQPFLPASHWGLPLFEGNGDA